MRPSPAWAPMLVISLVVPIAGCAEGLANAPAVNRQWTSEDFQHDVISNGPESCPREGRDPLAPEKTMRRQCPEQPRARPVNVPASP